MFSNRVKPYSNVGLFCLVSYGNKLLLILFSGLFRDFAQKNKAKMLIFNTLALRISSP